jgi:putative transposase
MVDRAHDLPITKQAAALNISRGSVYYLPRPVSAADLALMRRIDELHLEFPFAGSRLLRDLLAAEGSKIGRRHVTTLMKRMGIEALYRRPRTTKPEPGHKVLSVSAARCSDHGTEPGLGDGHHLHPRWRAASCAWPLCSTGSVGGFCRGACRSPRRRLSACAAFTGILIKNGHRNQHGTARARGETTSSSSAAVAQRQIQGGVSQGLVLQPGFETSGWAYSGSQL